MRHLLLASALVLGLAAPAFAIDQPASTTGSAIQGQQFYVVQDQKTHQCQVIDSKANLASNLTLLNDGAPYQTRILADSGMKSLKPCGL